MNKNNNLDFAENSIDAVVLAGKSKLIVQDKLNIIYSYFPIYNPYLSPLYCIENMNPPKSIDKASIDYKAVIKIDGKPMVNYIIGVLAESAYTNNIYVVGEEDQLNKLNIQRGKEKIKFVDDKNSFVDNLIEGGNKTKSKKILYSTSDIPLITSKDIDNFIAGCSHRIDGHFYLAYYLKEDYGKNFSGAKSGKFYQLGDKFVKNGCIFMLDRDFLSEINTNKEFQKIISYLYDQRKSKLKLLFTLAKYCLFNLALKYIFRKPPIEEAERILYEKTGYKFYGIESSPRLGVDIDSSEELQKIEEIIKKS